MHDLISELLRGNGSSDANALRGLGARTGSADSSEQRHRDEHSLAKDIRDAVPQNSTETNGMGDLSSTSLIHVLPDFKI